MEYQNNRSFARQLDQQDPLKQYREQFYFPKQNGKKKIYFCGNSLGLQPKGVQAALDQELEDWRQLAVEGHMQAENPWFYYHHFFQEPLAKLVGAQKEEVVAMNTLTTNLHLLMVSFYHPTKKRYKILVESQAFPSDHYAVESQARFHGFDPDETIVEVAPRKGEHTVRTEDILKTIEQHENELALILIGGVNFYTGQVFDMPAITKAGHEAGANVGFDLAHGTGNIPLELHDWQVDFAAWCSYKYLNSGPGGPGGIFVHEKHGNNPDLPRFAGWWGYDEDKRFEMKKGFRPQQGAAGWQLSNAQIFGMAAHKAALNQFDEAGMSALCKKSEQLTGYLFYLLEDLAEQHGQLKIITPRNTPERGCQVSLIVKENGKAVHEKLTEAGLVIDWREPEVIRLAPVPFYNTYEEVFTFAELLDKLL